MISATFRLFRPSKPNPLLSTTPHKIPQQTQAQSSPTKPTVRCLLNLPSLFQLRHIPTAGT